MGRIHKIAIAGNRNIESESISDTLKHEGYLFTTEETHPLHDIAAAVSTDKRINLVIFIRDFHQRLPLPVIGEIREANPEIRIMVISGSDAIADLTAAMDAGVNGYLNTNISKDELNFAVRHVLAGHAYIASSLYQSIFSMLSRPSLPERDNVLDGLPEREKQVLQLILEGHNNQEIAYQLFTTKNTVIKYRKSLLERTGQRDVAGLLQYAIRNGMSC